MDKPTEYRHAVAAEVRAELGRRQLTLLDVAAGTGLTVSTLSRRLNALSALSVDELAAIAKFLGLPVSHFTPEPAAAGAA